MAILEIGKCALSYTVNNSASKWLRNSLLTGSRTFRNDDEDHRICMVITLIVLIEDLKPWSGWHGDNPITRNTSTADWMCSAFHSLHVVLINRPQTTYKCNKSQREKHNNYRKTEHPSLRCGIVTIQNILAKYLIILAI